MGPFAMPRCQLVWRVDLPLQNETLSNCVNLKETLVSLRQSKVSGKMSKNPILLIPTIKCVIHFSITKRLCSNQNLRFMQVCPCVNKRVTCQSLIYFDLIIAKDVFWIDLFHSQRR